MELRIKDDNGQINLSIEIVGTETDGEWLICLAKFNYDGFEAKFKFSSMRGDFAVFAEQLKQFYKTLKGFAHYRSIEDNVCFDFSTDGVGHVDIEGYLRHRSYEVKISFLIRSDQTFLPELITECRQIAENGLS
jgi:hypothetical protein